MYYLCFALCVHQSQLSFHHHIFCFPSLHLPPSSPLPPCPQLTPKLLTVSVSLCFSVASRSIVHIWVKSYGSYFFLSGLFCLACWSQSPSILSQTAVFHVFLELSNILLCICTTASSYNHQLQGTLIVNMTWPPWTVPQWTRRYISLCKLRFSNILGTYPGGGLSGHVVTPFPDFL